MKKLILFIPLLFINIYLFGQKVKTEKIIISQNHIPDFKLPEQYNTFSNEYVSHDKNIEFSKDYLLHIDGFKQTSEKEPDFIIQFEVLESNLTYKMSKKTTSNSTGKQIRMEGTIKVDAKIDFKCNILNNDSILIYQLKYPNYQDIRKESYESSPFNSEISSDYDLKIKAKSTVETTIKRLLKKVMHETQIQLNLQLGNYEEDLEFKIATGKGRRFDYEDLDNALNLFKEASTQYSQNKISDNCIDLISKSINIWLAAVEEYKPNQKKVRISDSIISHIYYNLGVAYYLLENYEEAMDYTLLASELEDSKSLTARIKQRQKVDFSIK